MKDYSRNVSLICPFCGNDQFSVVDYDGDDLREAPDNALIKCSDCGRITTKTDLLVDNQEIINANIEEIKEQVIEDFDKEIKKYLRRLR